jgi:hypothetical protein
VTPEDTEATPEDTAEPEEEEEEEEEEEKEPAPEPEPEPEPEPLIDYSISGSGTFSSNSSTFTTTGGCELRYQATTPDATSTDGTVLLLHGFLRNHDRFADWSTHLASWGIPSVAVTMCHSAVWDNDADANADDVLELVAHLGLSKTLYVGHSNGAISALQAASLDAKAVGVLGLDAVEAVGTDHSMQAANLTIPAYGLFGESSQCNDANGGLNTFKYAPGSINLRVTESGHCDFEAPTDVLCELAPECDGENAVYSDLQIQNTIFNLATAFMRWQLSQDASGATWWTPGEDGYESLLLQGSISRL